jgi:hypothetical protein
MNVSSQPLVLPSNHHRRFLPTSYTPMFLNASPIAVSNKIKAIQARKTRLTLVSTDAVSTDIRPLNFGYHGGVTNSRTEFSVLTAERLVDRSKDIRLDRISTRQTHRPSFLLNTSNNQQSFLWSNYQPSTACNKNHQTQLYTTITTPPAIGSPKNKSSGSKIPDIPRRRNRQSLMDQHNSLIPIEVKQKSASKPQPSQNVVVKSRESTNNNLNTLPTSESDDNDENLHMDEEFEQYLEKAIVKCADWLIKYVFK